MHDPYPQLAGFSIPDHILTGLRRWKLTKPFSQSGLAKEESSDLVTPTSAVTSWVGVLPSGKAVVFAVWLSCWTRITLHVLPAKAQMTSSTDAGFRQA